MRRRKLIAPVIIAALLLCYYIALALVFNLVIAGMPLLLRIAMILIPAALCGVVIYVLAQRIREVRSGEEDDLDRY